ncbi:hypothetical protein [Robertmurraya massiliosenegalensis]|uniref:hypothetical protein n=1 Tax=Robertmurraya massiliosenegalensis TaxID=1287657 RepID=UPI000366EEDF|nr:hypothetical protein [Robertmurraya massiliosenegalensis]
MLVNFFRIFNAIVLWTIVIVFLPKRSLKRFLPVTLFCSVILLIQTLLNPLFNWWQVKGGYKYMIFDALAFILGPFFTINMWVFHFTYNRFPLYALVNLVSDFIFAYLLNPFFQKLGHYKLKNYTSTIIFIIFYSMALLNYAFQKLFEKPIVPEKQLN